MGYDRETMTGITHEVHVQKENGEIEKFEGVLDVMKLPNDTLKFNHQGSLKQFSDGHVMRSRVTNVNDAHKYVCPECESDETALITATDFGRLLEVPCPNCEFNGFERREL